MEENHITSTEDFIKRWKKAYQKSFHAVSPLSSYESLTQKERLSDMTWVISNKLNSWGDRLEEAPFFSGLLAVTQWVESTPTRKRLSKTDRVSFNTMMRFSEHIAREKNYHPQSWELLVRRVANRKGIVDECCDKPFLGVYGIDSIENEEQAFYTLYSVFEENALFLSPASALVVIDMLLDYGVEGIIFNKQYFYERYDSPNQTSEFYILKQHPHVLGLLLAMSMFPYNVEEFQELFVEEGEENLPSVDFATRRNHIIDMAAKLHRQQPGLRENSSLVSYFHVLATAKRLRSSVDLDELEEALSDPSCNDIATCSSFNVPSLCSWQFNETPGHTRESIAQKYSLKAMIPCQDDENSTDPTACKRGSNVLTFRRADDGSLINVGAVTMSFKGTSEMCLYSLAKNASETAYHDVVPEGVSFLIPQVFPLETLKNFYGYIWDDDESQMFCENDDTSSEVSPVGQYLKNVVADGVVCSTARMAFL